MQPPPIPRSPAPPIPVLGGGVAGLAAAVELARRGLRPRLIEARPFVGGRVRSFVHAASGDEIDNGQHLMMGCYHATFRLLETLGTRSLVSLQPRLDVSFRDADGTPARLRAATWLPSPLDVLWGMLRLDGLSRAERLALVRVARASRSAALRGETVSELLDRLGQSRRAQERLWDPIVIATLNTAPNAASAELFLAVMRRAFLGRGDDSRLALPRVGLSRLFDPAIEYIRRRGGTVELGASVTRIEKRHDDYRIDIKDQSSIEAARLVVALPPRAAATLLGPLIERSVDRSHDLATAGATGAALQLSPIVSLYLWFDRPLDAVPTMTALLGTTVQWVFNRRAIEGEAGGGRNGLLALTISAADDESASAAHDVTTIAERELRRAFPELAGARLVDALVVKEKHATFRATPAAESLRPPVRTAHPGLYLAGDWTATGLPATIEGAVQSGFDAAAAVVEALPHPRPLPAGGEGGTRNRGGGPYPG